jgi:signal transduction histidine kinase
MSNQTSFDALDTRALFRTYAAVGWVAGLFLYGWGGLVFRVPLDDGPSGSEWMAARIAGAALCGVGFLAHAMAGTDDDEARRKALGWWGAAHGIVFLGALAQAWAIIGVESLGWGGASALGALLAATFLFLFSWKTVEGMPWGGLREQDHDSVLREVRGASVQRLRSRYEEQIRAAASQEERNRLARDLHDSIKQQLFAIRTAAATAQARFEGDAVAARAAITQVRDSAREAMTEMEALLDQLRASPLENTGLVEALTKQCDALRFRTGADVRFAVGELPPSESLPPGAQQAVFRVAQEALANVGRHARATHVLVALDSTPFGVQLRVEDDGVGFNSGQAAAGMGLSNMRARIEPLGGTVAVSSTPGVGTEVRVSVPHAPQPSAADVAAYRRRALFYGAFCLIWLGGLPLWNLERDRLDLVMWGVLMVFNCVIAARAALAYHRARRSTSNPAGKARTA